MFEAYRAPRKFYVHLDLATVSLILDSPHVWVDALQLVAGTCTRLLHRRRHEEARFTWAGAFDDLAARGVVPVVGHYQALLLKMWLCEQPNGVKTCYFRWKIIVASRWEGERMSLMPAVLGLLDQLGKVLVLYQRVWPSTAGRPWRPWESGKMSKANWRELSGILRKIAPA